MRLARAIWFFLLLVALVIMGGFVWLLNTSYENIITLALDQLNRPDMRAVLKQQYFSEANFLRLRRAGLSLIFILVALIGVGVLKRQKIITGVHTLLQRIKSLIYAVANSVRGSSKNTQILFAVLLLLLLVRSVYYALTFYPQYDECWNYNYFLSTNIVSSAFAYNNYPLHNILTCGFLSLLPDNTFNMRIPNVILGLLNTVLIFALAKRIFTKEIFALIASAIFTVLPTVVFYMLFARGIMLALSFVIVIFYFLYVRNFKNCTHADWAIIILSGALGCYAMISFPVYLMLVFSLAGTKLLIEKKWNILSQLALVALGTAVLVLIFYTPMLLGTGLNFAAPSGYFIEEINWNAFIDKANFVSRNQIGFYTGAYIFLALNLVLLFVSKRRTLIVFNIVLLLIPFFVPLLFTAYLPARAVSFQALAYLFTIVITLEIFSKKTNYTLTAALAIVTIAGFNYVSVTHTFFTWSARQDKGVAQIARIFQQENITDYYDKSQAFQYFVPGILYHHKIKNRAISFYTADKNSSRFTPVDEYQGNTFVVQKAKFITGPDKEILYEYTDEDRAFVIYRETYINFR